MHINSIPRRHPLFRSINKGGFLVRNSSNTGYCGKPVTLEVVLSWWSVWVTRDLVYFLLGLFFNYGWAHRILPKLLLGIESKAMPQPLNPPLSPIFRLMNTFKLITQGRWSPMFEASLVYKAISRPPSKNLSPPKDKPMTWSILNKCSTNKL